MLFTIKGRYAVRCIRGRFFVGTRNTTSELDGIFECDVGACVTHDSLRFEVTRVDRLNQNQHSFLGVFPICANGNTKLVTAFVWIWELKLLLKHYRPQLLYQSIY